ncbi:MAG: quinolinate synthase NadA [Clostridium sp.]|uniref:quinolinate synthase NadA n=2 Tax=Clostridium sp. TaxID=1506 RepID=UPI002FCB8FA2
MTVNLKDEILRLKKEKNALILAHNYQIPEIQDVADVVGDSLKLSQVARETDCEIIIICGVHFMAESAKILAPNKKVFIPRIDAGCPMAEMIDVDKLREFKKDNNNAPVVCYVNSSAKVKAESDICCTSSNALSIAKSFSEDTILFAPDKHLSSYISSMLPEKNIIAYNGFCVTHNRIRMSEIEDMKEKYPDALLLVHPECDKSVVSKADFVGSTSAIIDFANKSSSKRFIIGTEIGVMHKLTNDNAGSGKEFYMLSDSLVCSNMKKNTLADLYKCLNEECNEIHVDEEVRIKAKRALDRMLEIS